MEASAQTLTGVATAPDSSEAGRLAEAFRLFSQASEELSESYTRLQAQVASLTAELALANGRLKREIEEKTALSERLALLLDTLPAGVAVLDVDGRVEQANPAASRLLGEDLRGSSWPVRAQALVATATPGEWRLADHPERRLAITEAWLSAGDGRLVLIQDVSEAHRMKTRAARNERLAAMGEMSASLAHQLRTPLAAAVLYAAALENPRLPEAGRQQARSRLTERLQHLERLIRDMLTFARGEHGGGETIEVGELIEEVLRTCEPLARQQKVSLRNTAASAMAAARVGGHRKALCGALVNLVENALHACAAGGQIEIAATAGDGQIHLQVIDDGCGIDAELCERLFEPFFTTRAEGTGLGLAIARGVVRSHGGELEVESVVGQGSRFTLTLPEYPPAAEHRQRQPRSVTNRLALA